MKDLLKYVFFFLTLSISIGFAISIGYNFEWTGFGSYTLPDGTYIPGKTLWDWAELLLIPVFLGSAAIWFNYHSGKVARETALDQYRETALLKYFDDIAELIKSNELLESNGGDPYSPSRFVAWQKTVAVSRMIDPKRKGLLLDFLYYSDLIYKDTTYTKNVVNLYNADFSDMDYKNSHLTNTNLRGVIFKNTDLTRTRLYQANLSESNLQDAVLENCNLCDADLSDADLTGAKLRLANLQLANLKDAKITEKQLRNLAGLAGAIMPDGQIYDGRFGFEKDIQEAIGCDVDVNDKNALALWYQSAREELDYLT